MSNKYYLEYKRPIPNVSDTGNKLYLFNDVVYQITYPKLDYKTIDWVIANPVAGSIIIGPRLQDALSPMTGFTYLVDDGSMSVNIYYGNVNPRTKLFSSDLAVGVVESYTSSFATSSLSAGTWLALYIVTSTKGTPKQVTVSLTLKYQK